MAATRPVTESSGELINALAQTAFTTMGALTRLAAENDLSLTQLRVLAILRDRRLRMTDLVDYLGLEKSTLSGLISRAAARGLVTRVPNPVDKRVVDVTLSEQGVAMATLFSERLTGLLAPMLDSLDETERDSLRDLLTKALAQHR